MIKRIFMLSVCLLFWFCLTSPVSADTPVSGSSATLNRKVTVKNDLRAKRLKDFLAKYGSPLTPYSSKIVQLADKYSLDWRLVTAISGVESTFCKAIPYNSYNCWGWNNGDFAFAGYDSALEEVSRVLRVNYFNKGYDTPEAISPIYAPPSTTWAGKVRYFMNILEDDTSTAFLAKLFSI